MDELKAILERLERLPEEVNVNAVFGKPETIEGRVLIPVAEVTYGFGVGAGSAPGAECQCECEDEDDACCADGECACGEDDTGEACCADGECACGEDHGRPASGAGGGAGAKARPIAYIEVGPDGARVQPIIDEQKVALAGILLGAWAVGWVGLVLKTLFTRR